MRNLFIIILTFVSLNSIAQFSTTLNDTLVLSNYGSNRINCICSDDSFYYANVNVIQINSKWGNKIVKFDKNFNINNERNYIDTNWINGNYPYNTIVVNNKQILICPQVSDLSYTAALGKIIAINKYNLDTLWTRIIAHPDTAIAIQANSGQFSVLTSIKETPEGGYILTGNYNKDCIEGNLRSFLLKIDSLGNIEWRRTYNSISYLFDIELTPSGGYIVLNKYGGTNVTILDSLGNILWTKKANNYIGMATSGALKHTGNNNYVVTTPYMYNTDTNNPLMGINMFKINTLNKQIIFDKTYILYHNIECIGLHQDIGIETTSDGSIIVNGTLAKYGVDKSGFILKLNSNGDSLWTKTYNFSPENTSQSQLNDLIITDDGGFLGVGFYYTFTSSTAWLFKTDSNGTIGWETLTPLSAQQLKIWPNPAKDFVNIEFNEILVKKSEIKIHNSLGQLVLQKEYSKGEKSIKLNIEGLKSGVYFIEIRNSDGVIGVGKLVVE